MAGAVSPADAGPVLLRGGWMLPSKQLSAQPIHAAAADARADQTRDCPGAGQHTPPDKGRCRSGMASVDRAE